jgi:hypothetical protein
MSTCQEYRELYELQFGPQPEYATAATNVVNNNHKFCALDQSVKSTQ